MTGAHLEACLIGVFARASEAGRVKTRLIPCLGALAAARLHAKLVGQAVHNALASGSRRVELWCTPSVRQPLFRGLATQYPLHLRTQRGGDLGERMADAFLRMLEHARGAILVGSDCPARTAQDFVEAREALQHGCDAVLGPVEDGGYHLIALRRLNPRLFAGVSWGTDRVLAQTRRRLRSLGWRWHELPERWDVDRPEDLARLLADPVLAALTNGLFSSAAGP